MTTRIDRDLLRVVRHQLAEKQGDTIQRMEKALWGLADPGLRGRVDAFEEAIDLIDEALTKIEEETDE